MKKFIHPVKNKFLSGVKNNLIFLFPILSGVLLILAYPPCNLGFLVWFAFLPLLWFIFSKKIGFKKAFIGGSITGILFFGKLFSWLFATAPFEWLGVTMGQKTTVVFIFLVIIYILQIVFLGLFFGVFAWMVKKITRRISWHSLLIIPAFWIVLEYLRAWGFGILYLGKESFLGPHWTFGNLSYALHNNLVLIQVADIAGIYGISFLIILVNVILFLLLKQCKRLSFTRIVVLLIILIAVGGSWVWYGIYEINKPYTLSISSEKKTALIQTNFSSLGGLDSYQKKEVFETVLGLLKSSEAQQKNPDIVIAPEGFGIISLAGDKNIAKYLLKEIWQPGQIFLENKKIIQENGKIVSRLFYHNLETEEPLGFHDKVLLVPNGEYLPYLTKALLSIYSFNMDYGQQFYEQGKEISPIQTSKGNIGGTICSSIVSPNIHRKITKQGAELLVVVSSDAPFHGSKSLLSQNLAMSKLRAVENKRYFAQATNMGYSFLLGPRGEIIVSGGPKLDNQIFFSNIHLIKEKTIYTRYGDWIIILSTIIILLTLILWYNKKS